MVWVRGVREMMVWERGSGWKIFTVEGQVREHSCLPTQVSSPDE